MTHADILSKEWVILDGGLSMELFELGYMKTQNDPLWSSRLLQTNPDGIKVAHKNFLSAGSEIILTNTYQASVDGFQKHLGLSEVDAIDLMKSSVRLAKQAVGEYVETSKTAQTVLVAGSVGPYGAVLHDGSEYTGAYLDSVSKQELKDWHRPRIKALLDGGVDLLAAETFPGQKEAEVIVDLLSKEYPSAKTWISFSCKDERCVCHGETLSAAVEAVIHSENVIAVGINCTSPHLFTPLLKSIQHLTIEKPILIKPNSGEKWDTTKGWYGRDSAPLFSDVTEWKENGASWFGGCCRVFPSDIERLKKAVNTSYKA